MSFCKRNPQNKKMNLSEFISSKLRNAWIEERNIKVYVRKSIRLFGKEMYQCLDLATAEVDEDKKGRGIFTKFLKQFDQEAKKLNRAVFLESILEPRLLEFFLKNGYKYVPGTTDLAPNMYKIVA